VKIKRKYNNPYQAQDFMKQM